MKLVKPDLISINDHSSVRGQIIYGLGAGKEFLTGRRARCPWFLSNNWRIHPANPLLLKFPPK